MAGVRVELLFVVLTGTLLLVLVRGWEQISETQLLNFYQTGQWSKPHSFTSPDDGRIFGDFDEQIPEDALPDVEGAATSSTFSPFAHHGFQLDTADSGLRDWTSSTGGGFNMPFVRTWSGQSSSELNMICSEVGFQMNLPTGPLSEVKVLGSKHLSVTTAPASCGYEVNSFKNTLTVPFTGCNVKLVGSCKTDSYSLQLLYVDNFGETRVATASCDVKKVKSDGANDQPTLKCTAPTTAPTTAPKAQNCAVTAGEQVPCGQPGMSSSACEMMGCCMDPSTSACYYPLDECTGDQHFVFAIRNDSASIPVDPTKLVIPGNTNCKPVILNDKVAIFKFKVTECGTRAYTVGETIIYLAEVWSTIKALTLKYGVITRSDPLRFMVECRYGKLGSSQQSLASVGYMVMTPKSILPSSILSNGLYAVELRIATDQTYSSFLPTYHQPLRLLLGKPVHLELRLRSPKPDAVILVNYCIAYPRSAKNALVLVYEGCRNPYDPKVSILQISDLPKNRHVRRFVVQAFQFMDQTTNQYLNEEIYFMCSTEVCRTAEKTCQEQCFDGK